MTLNNVVTAFHLLLIVAISSVTIAGFLLIPGDMILPVHWGITGAPDMFWHRNYALSLIPVVTVATLLIGALAILILRDKRSIQGRFIIRAAITGLLLLYGAIQTGIVVIGLGWDIEMARIVVLAMAILLILIGNAMPKSRPNGLAGLRLPWTLRDPAVWQVTHRIAGKLIIQAALVLAVLAFVLPVGAWLFGALLGCVLVPIIAASIISYLLSRRPKVIDGNG